jgi:hypothetical protein
MGGIIPLRVRRKQTPSTTITEKGVEALAGGITFRMTEDSFASRIPILLQNGACLAVRARQRQTIILTGLSQKIMSQGRRTTEMIVHMIRTGIRMRIGMTMTMMTMMVCPSAVLTPWHVACVHSSLVLDEDSSDYYY